MDAAEVKKLQEGLAAQALVNAKLLERAVRGDAREEATRILKTLTLHEASKDRVIDLVLSRDLPVVDGALDKVKFAEAVNAQAKVEGAYVATLTGAGRVLGMNSGGSAETDPVKIREAAVTAEADSKREIELAESVFSRLTGSKEAGKAAANKGVAA